MTILEPNNIFLNINLLELQSPREFLRVRTLEIAIVEFT